MCQLTQQPNCGSSNCYPASRSSAGDLWIGFLVLIFKRFRCRNESSRIPDSIPSFRKSKPPLLLLTVLVFRKVANTLLRIVVSLADKPLISLAWSDVIFFWNASIFPFIEFWPAKNMLVANISAKSVPRPNWNLLFEMVLIRSFSQIDSTFHSSETR